MSGTEAHEYTSVTEGVLQITVATAARGTSMDFGGIVAGKTALDALDSQVGAVLLTSTGANFCAGGDVRGFAAAADSSAHIYELADLLHQFVLALDAAPIPVVASAHRWAAGAGMSLVCAADIAIGGPGTKLRPAYPGLGLSPDGGMSWTLPRIVGKSRASEILLTDAVLDAESAVNLGILSRLATTDDAVETEAFDLAHSLAAGPRATHASIGRLLSRSSAATFGEQLDAERDAISAAADSPTGRAGVDAFVAKRSPDFTGLG